MYFGFSQNNVLDHSPWPHFKYGNPSTTLGARVSYRVAIPRPTSSRSSLVNNCLGFTVCVSFVSLLFYLPFLLLRMCVTVWPGLSPSWHLGDYTHLIPFKLTSLSITTVIFTLYLPVFFCHCGLIWQVVLFHFNGVLILHNCFMKNCKNLGIQICFLKFHSQTHYQNILTTFWPFQCLCI